MKHKKRKGQHWVAAVDSPDDISVTPHIGKTFKVRDEKGKDILVEAERITGNLRHAHMYQIDSKGKSYLISMLDFYLQVNGEYLPPEQVALWNATEYVVESPQERAIRLEREAWVKRLNQLKNPN